MASLPDMVLQAVFVNQVRSWNLVGALALFVYDNLLTLDREYLYVWKARWTLGKVIYIVIRYHWIIVVATKGGKYTFGVENSIKFCSLMSYVDVTTGFVETGLIQLTMVLRTCALYQNRRWVVWFLSVLFAACYFVLFAITYLWFSMHMPIIANPLPGVFMGCPALCSGCEPYVRTWWVPLVVLDSAMLVMTVVNSFQYVRGGAYSTRLLDILYRDGLLYFFVILGLEVAQLIMFAVMPLQGAGLVFAGTFSTSYWRAISGAVCSRLILNLRGVLTQSSRFDSAPSRPTDSRLRVTGTEIHFVSAGTDSTTLTKEHLSPGNSTTLGSGPEDPQPDLELVDIRRDVEAS